MISSVLNFRNFQITVFALYNNMQTTQSIRIAMIHNISTSQSGDKMSVSLSFSVHSEKECDPKSDFLNYNSNWLPKKGCNMKRNYTLCIVKKWLALHNVFTVKTCLVKKNSHGQQICYIPFFPGAEPITLIFNYFV
jgi:hypothetical protein